jgi:hypothetical protein
LRFHIFGLHRQDLLKVLGVDELFSEVDPISVMENFRL